MKLAHYIAGLALASSAFAGVTINFNVDQVYNANGVAVPTTGYGFIIADTTGDGFGTINAGSIAAGSTVGSSDYVVFAADFSTFFTDGVWSVAATNVSLTGAWGANDQLAFVWFPTLTAATTVTNGTQYGLATSNLWLTPADSNSDTFQIISATTNGFFSPTSTTLALTDSQARANLVVGGSQIPEPSSFAALAGFAVLGLAASRRRRA